MAPDRLENNPAAARMRTPNAVLHQPARLQEKVEILPVKLLDQQRPLVEQLRRLARSLRLEFGWHYLLDLTWIIALLGDVRGKTILDAGAGTGLIQWYLADHGAEVVSVDRTSRADLPLRFRQRYRVKGLRKQDLLPASKVIQEQWRANTSLLSKLKNQLKELIGVMGLRLLPGFGEHLPGKVSIYNQDLLHLEDIQDGSIDFVVSVSALEHNPPDNLPLVRAELMRVLRPGGALLATLCAAQEQDWFHEPSQGWCYTEASLRRLFDLPDSAPSNYARYEELFTALRGSVELRENLARFYTRTSEGGMPWGIWDPKYQPVGVCKINKEGTYDES